MNTLTVPRSPTRSTVSFKPRPTSSSTSYLPDDAHAAEIFHEVDTLEETRDKLLRALNTLARSTYERPAYNRRRARQLVLEAWVVLAGTARDLATQPPKFRAGSTGPRPLVRHRRIDAEIAGVEDIRTSSLPPALVGVAR